MQTVTPAQLQVHLRHVFQRHPGARLIAYRGGAYAGPPVLSVEDQQVRVQLCASVLAMREAVVEAAESPEPHALITAVAEDELGLDVLCLLLKRRLFALSPWDLVRQMFQARTWDPALTRRRWLAEALIDGAREAGYPPVPSGLLDENTAWGHVLTRRFGLPQEAPALEDLLRFADTPAARRLQAEPDEILEALADRLATTAGPLARTILAFLRGRPPCSAAAAGLACRVLAHDARGAAPTLDEARVRLEQHLGHRPLSAEEARVWADAAEALVRTELAEKGRTGVGPQLGEAERLLVALRADAFAHRSDLLPLGLTHRLSRWGERLAEALASSPPRVDDGLHAAASAVREHALAGEAVKADGIDMALRLVRWLERVEAAPLRPPRSFAEALRAYAAEESYVDWARSRLWDGGHPIQLRRAYATLAARARAAREEQDRRFGPLLQSWARGAGSECEILPVERILARVVGPIADAHPVLLVVLDGMSYAVFRELEPDLAARGLTEQIAEDLRARAPAVSAFPSATRYSRASLLSGELVVGDQSLEKQRFPEQPLLRQRSRAGRPPIVFHKGDLEVGGSGLPAAVHAAIADRARRVVAVVVNAVDDHLTRGDQISVRWTTEQIRPLDALLTAAEDAGRVIVLTSDHGHVLERGSSCRPVEGADERWRPAGSGEPRADEIALRGPRVLAGDREGIVAPWAETVRYSKGKRHGYHGGGAPAEVAVPLAVYAAEPLEVPGWSEGSAPPPLWWRAAGDPAALSAPREKGPPALRPPTSGKGWLFEVRPPRLGSGAPAKERWIDALFASDRYRDQQKKAARVALSEGRVRRILAALDSRGGRLTLGALQQEVGLPPQRVRGIVASLRRLLNVEGYPILSLDEASATLALNRRLLGAQFEIEVEAGS